jgi:outer membrane protein TolC
MGWRTAITIMLMCVLTVTSTVQAAPGSYPKESVDLVDCINRALEKNTRILAAKQMVEKSKGVIIQTKAVRYPRVEMNSRLGLRNDDVFNNSGNQRFREDWRIDIRATQSLFSAGENSKKIRISELEQENEYINLQKEINQVVLDVKLAYYQALLYTSQAKIQKSIIVILETEVKRQKSLFDAGRSSKFDILRTEVRLTNERPRLLDAQVGVRIAIYNLARLLGENWVERMDDESLIQGYFECPPMNLTLDELVSIAQRQRPDGTYFQKKMEIAELNEKIAKVNNVPRLDGYIQAGEFRDTGKGSGFFDNAQEVAFGVLGRWNVFDGFTGRGKVTQARAAFAEAALNRDDAVRGVDYQVRQAFLKLKQAEKTMEILGGNKQRANESLRLAQNGVENGVGTQFDVLQATVDLNQTEGLELQAQFNYQTALAELEYALFENGSMKNLEAKGSKETVLDQEKKLIRETQKPGIKTALQSNNEIGLRP